jgi:carboxymethylenebutenolidase
METREVDHSILKGGGFLALPSTRGKHAGVVVIHEAYGLNDPIKDVAKRFAESDYVALAVDLFSDRNRALCMARYLGGMLRGAVERPGIEDLKFALSHLVTLPEVDPQRVGAIGFCMGGSFAVAWACTDDRLKAIAPFSASNPRPLSAVARMCPVVGSYPARDFTASAGRALDAELTRRQIDHDIKVYPDARHSFFINRKSTAEQEAADDAWDRVLTFFGTHLAAPPAPPAAPKTPPPKRRRTKQRA